MSYFEMPLHNSLLRGFKLLYRHKKYSKNDKEVNTQSYKFCNNFNSLMTFVPEVLSLAGTMTEFAARLRGAGSNRILFPQGTYFQ